MVLALSRCRPLPLLHPPASCHHVIVPLHLVLIILAQGCRCVSLLLSSPRQESLLCRWCDSLLGDGKDAEQSPKELFPLGSAELYVILFI